MIVEVEYGTNYGAMVLISFHIERLSISIEVHVCNRGFSCPTIGHISTTNPERKQDLEPCKTPTSWYSESLQSLAGTAEESTLGFLATVRNLETIRIRTAIEFRSQASYHNVTCAAAEIGYGRATPSYPCFPFRVFSSRIGFIPPRSSPSYYNFDIL